MQHWVGVWFQWVNEWGYPGIVMLMAMESSVIPIPSEIIIPPAAYWAAQGRYSFGGGVLAGCAPRRSGGPAGPRAGPGPGPASAVRCRAASLPAGADAL